MKLRVINRSKNKRVMPKEIRMKDTNKSRKKKVMVAVDYQFKTNLALDL